MPELIAPAVGLHAAWLEAHAEWGPGSHEDGFGLSPSDEVESPAGFAAWRWAGHVGYGIRPSARGRGLAAWALGGMLDEARTLGLDRVPAVCTVDNVASIRTIERCGGVFEGIRDTGFGPLRRFWIRFWYGLTGVRQEGSPSWPG